jgi:hypothetical protein
MQDTISQIKTENNELIGNVKKHEKSITEISHQTKLKPDIKDVKSLFKTGIRESNVLVERQT